MQKYFSNLENVRKLRECGNSVVIDYFTDLDVFRNKIVEYEGNSH